MFLTTTFITCDFFKGSLHIYFHTVIIGLNDNDRVKIYS